MNRWTWLTEHTVKHFNGNEVSRLTDGRYRAYRRLCNGFETIGTYDCPQEAGAAAANKTTSDAAQGDEDDAGAEFF